MPVGIDHRVETRQVARRIRIAKRRSNTASLHLAAQLLGNGLPLSGRCFQADVAIGGDAVAVHDDTHTTLMPLGVEVAESHHIGAASVEVAVCI